MSRANECIIKSPATINDRINELEPRIKNDLKPKKEEFINDFRIPYEIPGSLLLYGDSLYITPE